MNILLVNDDGVSSPAVRLLAKKLGREHTVIAVLPDGNRSAVGHGITMNVPLMVKEVEIEGCKKAYAVSGTPADCTRLGVAPLMGDHMPVDLVVSGPNLGCNLSFDILYSGTASGALEGAMWGKKAIAVSAPPQADFDVVTDLFVDLLAQLEVERDIHHMLNINIPALPRGEIKGVQWVRQGTFHQWSDRYEHRTSPGGCDYYWIDGDENHIPPAETDSYAMQEGYVSVTPLSFDLTDEHAAPQKELTL